MSKPIMCPFFRETTRKYLTSIFCSDEVGEVEKKLKFPTSTDMKMHKDKHCRDVKGYARCRNYVKLESKY